MKVILRQNVQSLGKAGDTIKVADGYARNFLIPKGLAAEANTRNLKTFEHEKQRILQQAQKIQSQAEETAAKLGGVTCTIARRVGEQEKLFGSVGVKDIEEALAAKGSRSTKGTSCWMSRSSRSVNFPSGSRSAPASPPRSRSP